MPTQLIFVSEYAASFFLLADHLRDAANVVANQMGDLQLAITITRAYEGENGPVLRELLEKRLLPEAAMEGNRWMASWAFWMLGRRDMAVRALIVSSQTDPFIPPTNIDAVTYRDPAFAHSSLPREPRTRYTPIQVLPLQ